MKQILKMVFCLYLIILSCNDVENKRNSNNQYVRIDSTDENFLNKIYDLQHRKKAKTLMMICFIGDKIIIDSQSIEFNDYKQLLRTFFTKNFDNKNMFEIHVFYKKVSFSNYEKLINLIHENYRDFLNRKALKLYGSNFSMLSSMEKEVIGNKINLLESEVRASTLAQEKCF